MDIENIVRFKDGKKVLMDGPLSRIFTQILNEEYVKEIDKETGMVLESQIFQVLQKASSLMAANKASLMSNEVGMLYAVDSDKTIAEDLAKIATAYSVMSNNQLRSSAVIINGETTNIRQKYLNDAIEGFCIYSNIPMYSSLEMYMRTHKVV